MIDEIDWGSLEHAYGRATDTAAHLKALASRRRAASVQAGLHLGAAVLHQGLPWTATAPAVRVVTRMLAEDMVLPDIRRGLVEFLGDVAEATEHLAQGSYFSHLRTPLLEAVQESYPVVMRFLDDPDIRMRVSAAQAAFWHVQISTLADLRAVLARRLLAWAEEPSEHRAFWIRLLGMLGHDTREFLKDPDLHIRTAAALSSSLADDDLATEVIIEALSRAALNGVVDESTYTLHLLVRTAIARVDDLQRIAVPALEIARRGGAIMGHRDCGTWGPLLHAIFHPPYTESAKLSPLQREFLVALVENSRVWNYWNGNLR